MTINEIQDEIISDFEMLEDWNDKYGYIIELGKKLAPLAEEHKTEDRIIKGCQSRVWLYSYLKDNKVQFEADSDAIIVKGLVYLLLQVLNNQSAEDVAKSDLYFIDKIGMAQHLSPTRANGLLSMVKQMKLYGVALNMQS